MDNKTAEKALEKLLRANESEYTSVRHFVEHWLGGEGKVREMIEVAESHKDRLVFLRFGIANIRQALHRENRRGAINDTLWVLQNVSPNLTLFDYMDFLLDETEHAALSAPRVGRAALSVQDVSSLEDYDSGLLNDYGGGNVGWWQDYIRHEVDAANQYWREQVESMLAASPDPVAQDSVGDHEEETHS